MKNSAVLPFDRFWAWLAQHHNCILSAGTTDAWIFDQDDLHWHLYHEGDRRGLQLIRGKQVLGELTIAGSDVVYVEMHPSAEDQENFEFHAMGGSESDLYPLYHFVMAHSYDESNGDSAATH